MYTFRSLFRSAVSIGAGYLVTALLTGILYTIIQQLVVRGLVEEQFFSRNEIVLGIVTAVFSVIGGFVLGVIAPKFPLIHASIFVAVFTLILLFGSLSPFDAFFVWLQVAPGMIIGSSLVLLKKKGTQNIGSLT